jgi:BED zinc finger
VDNAATCSTCGIIVKRLPGNTSNLIVHLERAHVEDQKTHREMDERQKRDVEL